MGDTTGIKDTTCELEGVTDITGLEEGDGVGLIGGAGVGGLKISPVIDMTNGTTLLTVRPCFEQSTNRYTCIIERVNKKKITKRSPNKGRVIGVEMSQCS